MLQTGDTIQLQLFGEERSLRVLEKDHPIPEGCLDLSCTFRRDYGDGVLVDVEKRFRVWERSIEAATAPEDSTEKVLGELEIQASLLSRSDVSDFAIEVAKRLRALRQG